MEARTAKLMGLGLEVATLMVTITCATEPISDREANFRSEILDRFAGIPETHVQLVSAAIKPIIGTANNLRDWHWGKNTARVVLVDQMASAAANVYIASNDGTGQPLQNNEVGVAFILNNRDEKINGFSEIGSGAEEVTLDQVLDSPDMPEDVKKSTILRTRMEMLFDQAKRFYQDGFRIYFGKRKAYSVTTKDRVNITPLAVYAVDGLGRTK